MKILLIDDSRSIRLAIQQILTKAGHCVTGLGDGEEGLRVARESIPDLVLLDMMLPKVTGLDVLRALKQDSRTKHIPVIVLSGLSQANEAKLAKEGAAGFLEKSADILQNGSTALIEAVESAAGKATGPVSM
jgi:CheY-like chemotaxis protein